MRAKWTIQESSKKKKIEVEAGRCGEGMDKKKKA